MTATDAFAIARFILFVAFIVPAAAFGENRGLNARPATPTYISIGETARLNPSAIKTDSVVFTPPFPKAIEFSSKICGIEEVRGVSRRGATNAIEINYNQFGLKPFKVKFASVREERCEEESVLNIYFHDFPQWKPPFGTAIIWHDSGVAEYATQETASMKLAAIYAGKIAAENICLEQKKCSLKIPQQAIKAITLKRGGYLALLPEDFPIKTGADAPLIIPHKDEFASLETYSVEPKSVVFAKPLIESDKLIVDKDSYEIEVRLPEAIARISCDTAECRITQKGVLVFQIEPQAAELKIRYSLKPQFVMKARRETLSNFAVTLALERCSIGMPTDVPLLSGTSNHTYFVNMPRECTSYGVNDIYIETMPPTQTFIRAERKHPETGERLLELVIDRVPANAARLQATFFERGAALKRIGGVRIPIAREFAPAHLRFEVEKLGMIDFIPNNRKAYIKMGYASPRWIEECQPESRPGFYEVAKDETGYAIKAEPNFTGSIPLKFAYRPKGIAKFINSGDNFIQSPALVSFHGEVVYPIKTINVPMPLHSADKEKRFIKVLCGSGENEREIFVGSKERIPHDERDSCRIIFDAGKIPEEAGMQRLRVKAGEFDQIITLAYNGGTLTVTVPAEDAKEFDVITISVTHDFLSGHYTLLPQQNLGENARYRLILSDRHLRISATPALPTGLFRFGSDEISGAVPISVGVLSRLTYVDSNGSDFPIGLEFGLFGTNLSGSPDLSIITGIGLSIPVLNTNTPLQTSFNIHVWLEYAPLRHSKENVSPFALMFGPSFSIGRLSTTF